MGVECVPCDRCICGINCPVKYNQSSIECLLLKESKDE